MAGEWETFRAVRLAALTDSPSAFGSTFSEEEGRTEDEWRARLAGRDQFIAEDGAEVLGTVGLLRGMRRGLLAAQPSTCGLATRTRPPSGFTGDMDSPAQEGASLFETRTTVGWSMRWPAS
jgi:hypothetical protein